MKLLVLISAILYADAFTINSQKSKPSWELASSVIRGDDLEIDAIDPLAGGVGLTMESAVKIIGNVKHKAGSAEAQLKGLLRYSNLKETSESLLKSGDASIVGIGSGKEKYTPPGSGLVKEVFYAPLEAVKDALSAAGSTQGYSQLVFNFLGGDDLQIFEVTDGLEKLVLKLDVKIGTPIKFNSVSHKSIPMGTTTVTVVGLGAESSTDGKTGEERSIATGEVYSKDGKLLTLVEEDRIEAQS